MFGFPDIRPGSPFLAEQIAALYRALRGLDVQVVPPLYKPPGRGNTIALGEQGKGEWIKLTSNAGNAWAWVRQIPQAGGGWLDDANQQSDTTTDPAAEINGNTQAPTLPLRVRAWRDPRNNTLYFQLGVCS